MSSLQSPNLSSSPQKRVRAYYAAINAPTVQRVLISLPKNLTSSMKLLHEFNGSIHKIVPSEKTATTTLEMFQDSCNPNKCKAKTQLHAILKTVAEKVEMHENIDEQRKNWNCLLLNSINLMMARLINTSIVHNNALRLTSILLLTSAKGMLLITNKIQTSKPNATTLFEKLQSDIQSTLALGNPTEEDVKKAMERVLALDKAYPSKFEPALWWPKAKTSDNQTKVFKTQKNANGMSLELERKNERLGNLALKINKTLAISGDLLVGIAALGSALASHGVSWAGIVAAMAGSLEASTNALEHGGQVGIVFEMYKNCGGFFKLLKEIIQVTLEEKDGCIKREDGETFEKKVAMQGRGFSH
ncbi:hypothetical protein K1719_001075 [Acacia pycnantha]|nr:hypothetical protein K1719_001075 [Acacia pycnantha]